MRIVAVGDMDFITGFQLAGIKQVYEAEDSWTAKNALEMIKGMNDVAIVIIQRRFARELREFINEWKLEKDIYPVIIDVPDHRREGEYEDPMREVIRRAIGVDILKR